MYLEEKSSSFRLFSLLTRVMVHLLFAPPVPLSWFILLNNIYSCMQCVNKLLQKPNCTLYFHSPGTSSCGWRGLLLLFFKVSLWSHFHGNDMIKSALHLKTDVHLSLNHQALSSPRFFIIQSALGSRPQTSNMILRKLHFVEWKTRKGLSSFCFPGSQDRRKIHSKPERGYTWKNFGPSATFPIVFQMPHWSRL